MWALHKGDFVGSFSLFHWIIVFGIGAILWKLFGGGSKPAKAQAAGPVAFDWPPLDEYEASVVGEGSYQRALAALAGSHGDEAANARHMALLVPESGNPHDDKAVRVEIGGETVGYLSREDARTFRRRLSAKKLGAAATRCGALVMGGFVGRNGQRASYGVQLDIKPFD
jgi:hypothetical protein